MLADPRLPRGHRGRARPHGPPQPPPEGRPSPSGGNGDEDGGGGNGDVGVGYRCAGTAARSPLSTQTAVTCYRRTASTHSRSLREPPLFCAPVCCPAKVIPAAAPPRGSLRRPLPTPGGGGAPGLLSPADAQSTGGKRCATVHAQAANEVAAQGARTQRSGRCLKGAAPRRS